MWMEYGFVPETIYFAYGSWQDRFILSSSILHLIYIRTYKFERVISRFQVIENLLIKSLAKIMYKLTIDY